MLLAAAPARSGVRADFDGDHRDDLAIGIEGEDLPAPIDCLNSGAVTVIYGTDGGLDPESPPGDQFWHEEVDGVRGNCTGDDGFGDAVAAGDFDGNGLADLAIGVTGDIVNLKPYAGSIRVLYGTRNGLTASDDDAITETTKGVPGGAGMNDELGEALAAGDFDGDGRDDLAAQVACERVEGEDCAGAILVFSGGANGLTAKGTKRFTQATAGIAGRPDGFEQFGTALAAGELDGKGSDDLAIGTPSDSVGGVGAGTVQVLFGDGQGLSSTGDKLIHEGKGTIFGDPAGVDQFGASLATGRIDPGGVDELAIGVPSDDDATSGLADVLYGSGRGPKLTGSQSFSQAPDSVLGAAEDGDRFGESVELADFDGGGRDDLAAGSPGDNDAGSNNAGALNVLFSAGGELTVEGDQLIHQAVPFAEGVSETLDRFGEVLAAGRFDAGPTHDLAVTVAFDDAGAVDGAGSVQVFYGEEPSGLSLANDELFHQGLAEIQNEPGDQEYFGDSLDAGW